MLFSLLTFLITSTVILASPTSSGLGDVNELTLSCASDDSLLPTDGNSITGEIDISKRSKGAGICQPIKSGVGTGTDTQGQSTENDAKSTNLDDNPCDDYHPHYLSCGGPELIYKSGRLYGVMNCVKGKFSQIGARDSDGLISIAIETIIESRGLWKRDDKLNEYCCDRFMDEVSLHPSYPDPMKESKERGHEMATH